MSVMLISPSRKYFAGYLEACEEYKNAEEISYLHDLEKFAGFKPDEPIEFSTWKKNVRHQYAFEEVNGRNEMITIPASNFWLVDENGYIGIGTIRHVLTKSIEEYGGHIGYAIRRSRWNQGFGTIQLKLLLKEAARLGINPALVTCSEENIASVKIIEHNGGILRDKLNQTEHGKKIILRRYWVKTK